MSKDQIHSVSNAHIADSDEIRRVLAVPCTLPFSVRRETALCLASHLSGNAFHKAPGETSGIVGNIVATAEWKRMTEAAEKNDLMPKLILRTVLTELFASLNRGTDVLDGMKSAWNRVYSLIRTMDSVASLCPAFDSLRDAHLELITYPQSYENIIKRNDDAEWIAKIIRSMMSEMIGHDRKELCNGHRKILVVIDTSKSMYGEPEIIAKGLILALTKRMLTDRRDVDVILFSSDLSVLSPSGGKDLMNFISFRSGNGEPFADALNVLLSKMKDNSVNGTDIILVSKGTGILNDHHLTEEWISFKTGRDVNVITAVTGGNDACGLTELSDHIVIFNEDTMSNGAKEFARLIDLLS